MTRCRNQLDQCAQDIRSCQAEMAQACKQLKEEERQVRVSRANKSQHLTRRLQKLRIAERELYFELAFLRELKRRNQSEENEGIVPAYLADIELGDISDVKTRGETLLKDSHLVEQAAPTIEAGDENDIAPDDEGDELYFY